MTSSSKGCPSCSNRLSRRFKESWNTFQFTYLLLFTVFFCPVSEVIFVKTSAVKDVCGKPPNMDEFDFVWMKLYGRRTTRGGLVAETVSVAGLILTDAFLVLAGKKETTITMINIHPSWAPKSNFGIPPFTQ
ncbi:hypothetical protein V8G54_010380 [Vigna mungo]|uniref:Uncharacterized protein n=1 Tax=Vigna mungo TaxID=3915 RepID=A0AAQ3NXF6_VIGMU